MNDSTYVPDICCQIIESRSANRFPALQTSADFCNEIGIITSPHTGNVIGMLRKGCCDTQELKKRRTASNIREKSINLP